MPYFYDIWHVKVCHMSCELLICNETVMSRLNQHEW